MRKRRSEVGEGAREGGKGRELDHKVTTTSSRKQTQQHINGALLLHSHVEEVPLVLRLSPRRVSVVSQGEYARRSHTLGSGDG